MTDVSGISEPRVVCVIQCYDARQWQVQARRRSRARAVLFLSVGSLALAASRICMFTFVCVVLSLESDNPKNRCPLSSVGVPVSRELLRFIQIFYGISGSE